MHADETADWTSKVETDGCCTIMFDELFKFLNFLKFVLEQLHWLRKVGSGG